MVDLSMKDLVDLNKLYAEDPIPCDGNEDCENPVAWRMLLPCCNANYMFCQECTDHHVRIIKEWHAKNSPKQCSECKTLLNLDEVVWVPA